MDPNRALTTPIPTAEPVTTGMHTFELYISYIELFMHLLIFCKLYFLLQMMIDTCTQELIDPQGEEGLLIFSYSLNLNNFSCSYSTKFPLWPPLL